MPPNTAKSESAARLFYADALRAYAIICVIFIHASAGMTHDIKYISIKWWWIANAFNSLCRPSVPIFLMLSGMFLLEPERRMSLSQFYKKRFGKVLLPFLVWSLFYLFVLKHYNPLSLRSYQEILTGPVWGHMWFVYVLLGLYLVTPVLQAYIAGADRENMRYFIGLWFVIEGIMPSLGKFLGIYISIKTVVATNYVGYYILGYYLRPVFLNKKQMGITAAVFIAASAFTAVSTYFLSVPKQKLNEFFYWNSSPSVIIASVAIFLLLKSIDYEAFFKKCPKPDKVKGAISYISTASYSIYLIHIIFLRVISRGWIKFGTGKGAWAFKLSGMTWHPFFGIPATALVCILMSLALIWFLRKIPVLKKIAEQ